MDNLELDSSDVPFAFCQLCGGPIWSGGPAVQHGEGWAHRFKMTCQHVREDREKAEEAKRLVQ